MMFAIFPLGHTTMKADTVANTCQKKRAEEAEEAEVTPRQRPLLALGMKLPIKRTCAKLTSGALSLDFSQLPWTFLNLSTFDFLSCRNIQYSIYTLYLCKGIHFGATLQPTTDNVSERFLISTAFSSLRLRMQLIVVVVLHMFMGRWHKRHLAEQIQSKD